MQLTSMHNPEILPTVAHIAGPSATQWYPPVMIGIETIKRKLFSLKYIESAQRLLSHISPDDYSIFLKNFYTDGIDRFGGDWYYADIVTVLLCISETIKPRNYLEIGVRRGRSAAAVASMSPSCAMTLLDMWAKDYAGMPNPGSEFVAEELRNVGHKGIINFIDGNSHVTLPALFEQQPNLQFDLITVDGDHSTEGARLDLEATLPRLRIGGAIVFDDISHPAHPSLSDVWHKLVEAEKSYSSFSFRDAGYGVGFAIRKY